MNSHTQTHSTVNDHKKLYLSDKNRMVSGVCGGLAEYYEVDVNLIRLAWVVLTILSGVIPGVLAYVAAALLIPKEQLE